MSHETRIGVDIGGTFTDLVLVDDESGALTVGKLLTTPENPAKAVEAGITALIRDAGANAQSVKTLVHATTLATNGIIERRGGKTALVTTTGFRDAIEIAREGRYDMYDLMIDPPAPLVRRRMRFEVAERILADGSVMVPLEDGQAASVIRDVISSGAETVAVSLLHAHVNPAHERRVAALIAELAPKISVSCSSEVAPEIREYERTSTAIANAYVMPLVASYLKELERRVREIGISGSFYVMLSSGGIATCETAKRFPVRLIESGPAAGVVAAARFARLVNENRLLSFDMGGTTAKACIIDGGEPLVAHEFEVARAARFKKGSGLPILAPAVELIEIGAGGGSIAWVDSMGLLKVGPQSAGASPGPACYGLGGVEPTVTDADLVLGYLDPNFFLGGNMRLDVDAARGAIEERIEGPLGLDLTSAAWGIHRVVGESMAAAAAIHGIERGKDIRAYSLFVFGGAGPVHCWELARALRVARILIPFGAGAMSALGLLAAPLAFDFVRTARQRLDDADWNRINSLFDEMESEGRAILASSGITGEQVTLKRSAEMRYVGQGHETEVAVPPGQLSAASLAVLNSNFETAYRALYHLTIGGGAIEALNWRLRVSGPTPVIGMLRHGESSRYSVSDGGSGSNQPVSAVKGSRRAYFQKRGFVDTPVYDRYALYPGFRVDGPAIIEERESTAIIGVGGRCVVDHHLTLVIEMPQAKLP
jgi:N-methylhydantoinase A